MESDTVLSEIILLGLGLVMDQWWSNCMFSSYYRTEKHQSRNRDDSRKFKGGAWSECNTVTQSRHASLPQVYGLQWSH